MDNKPSIKTIFTSGLFSNNPAFVQFLGMCPTLAVTSKVENALGMGIGTIFVLVMSNLVISLIRKVVPDEVRIPIYIVIIAALVTILEMMMNAFVPELAAALGTFLKLIVVNCIILGRAEAFAAKNTPLDSVADGLGMGLGFTGGIALIALFRELLGTGSVTVWGDFGFEVSFITSNNLQLELLSGPAGAFLVFGILVSQMIKLQKRKERKELEKAEVTI